MRSYPRRIVSRAAIRGPVVTLIPFILLFLSCGGPGEEEKAETEKSRYGGALYFGVESGFYGFDVLGVGSAGIHNPNMVALINMIQEPLFRMDRDGNPIPVLGLSAAPSGDGTAWDITLREGVVFHDGAPFNADAVVHHWGRMLNPANKFRGRTLFQPVREVEKTGEYTVRFILEHPWPVFLEFISDEIYSSTCIPSPGAVDAGTHDRKPVGTGPFKYGEWKSRDHFILNKNENYWHKGLPYLNKVVFRSLPDHQTRFASLLAGQLDAVVMDLGNLIQQAKKDKSLYTYASDGNGAEIVLLNSSRPPLDDARVRRALALANNQDLHVKMVYRNAIPFVRHPFGEWFTCMDDGYPEHDPEKARQLIAEYGKPVEIECLHSNTSRGRGTGELLQQLYKKIGVTLKPAPTPPMPQVMKVVRGDYQLATWRILGSVAMTPQLYRNFHSKSPTNYSRHRSPVMDELLEAQRTETDPEKRNEILCKLVRHMNEDGVILYRGGRRRHIIARKKIMNITDVSGVRLNLATAWIDDPVRFNMLAFEIEKNAAPAFECPEPGDVEAVKSVLLGPWEGKDNWGATIRFHFHADGTASAKRTGGSGRKIEYQICGSKIFMQGSARIELTVAGDTLEGAWQKGEYKGTIVMNRQPSS